MICFRDSIEFTRKLGNNDTVFVSLDQSKAFDMVDHKKRLGVENKVLCLVKTMYQTISTRVQVNGVLSDPVSITRGVRQGCPLSPSLYVIYIEAILRAITQCRVLSGCPLPDPDICKYLAYADDL